MIKRIANYCLIAFIIAITLQFVAAEEAQDVNVGLYVLNLGKFDISTGAFTADFYLSLQCDNPCEAENFEFMNGRASSIEKIVDEPNEKFYRIQANLNSPVGLKEFPFDRQQMKIIIEDKENAVERLKYIPLREESGIDDSIAFTGWNIDGWDASAQEHEYSVYDETYSQYVFTITISKIAWNSFIKTFLPVFFILLVVLFSFLLDPDKISTRLGMVGSSLVASVMFHVSIANQIPPVAYLTFADKFMLLTYFILLSAFVQNILMLELLELKKTELVENIHRKTEYTMFLVVPLLYLLLFLFFL